MSIKSNLFRKKIRNKKQKLESITKKSLGKDFEVFSIDCFPHILAVYSGKITDNDWIAHINVKKNSITLFKEKYLSNFYELREKYKQEAGGVWKIEKYYVKNTQNF